MRPLKGVAQVWRPPGLSRPAQSRGPPRPPSPPPVPRSPISAQLLPLAVSEALSRVDGLDLRRLLPLLLPPVEMLSRHHAR
ncbi:uncharacterized protein J3R85_008258 [Psidium guajava]|nr:uncharacterized protein J3R85_008258 [Psidium guajava]